MGLARGSMRGVWKSREGRRRKQGQLLLVVEALTSAYSTLTETRHCYTLKSSFGAGKERGKCAQVSSWPIISPQKSTPNWVNSSTSPRETKCFSKGENKTIAHSGAEHERHELNQGEHLKKMSFSCWGQLEKNFGYNSCVPCPKKPFWFPAILLPASQLRNKAHHSPVQTAVCGLWFLCFYAIFGVVVCMGLFFIVVCVFVFFFIKTCHFITTCGCSDKNPTYLYVCWEAGMRSSVSGRVSIIWVVITSLLRVSE